MWYRPNFLSDGMGTKHARVNAKFSNYEEFLKLLEQYGEREREVAGEGSKQNRPLADRC